VLGDGAAELLRNLFLLAINFEHTVKPLFGLFLEGFSAVLEQLLLLLKVDDCPLPLGEFIGKSLGLQLHPFDFGVVASEVALFRFKLGKVALKLLQLPKLSLEVGGYLLDLQF